MSEQIDKYNVYQVRNDIETQNATLISKKATVQLERELIQKSEEDRPRTFSERWKTNRFWLVRGTYQVLRSVWMVAMVVGGFMAWLIAMLFI